MTVEARPRRVAGAAPPGTAAILAACAGCVAIASRTPSWAAVGVTAAVGAAAALAPAENERRAPAVVWCAVVALGVAAFASIRLASLLPISRPTAIGIGFAALAAVCEELFFRRFLYGVFVRWGTTPAAAIAICAVAFALVHIPAYGIAKAPINFAAGILLGWQRWATGTWTSSAATHLAANVLSLV